MHHPKLLFLDAYDSFSNNIISLLHTKLGATVTILKIDDKRFATASPSTFHNYLRTFDGVVAGPGPGDPRIAPDLGLIGRLWDLPDGLCVPVLGICLGFQSLGLAFGGEADRLKEPRHGLVTEVSHSGKSLYSNAGVVKATQYHSLHIRLGHDLADPEVDLWESTAKCASLEPLAWDLSDSRNGPVLMSVKHRTKPYWGVQYHPESICSNEAGSSVFRNWWSEALAWNIQKVAAERQPDPWISASAPVEFDCDSDESDYPSDRCSSDIERDSRDADLLTNATTPASTRNSSRVGSRHPTRRVAWKVRQLPDHDVSATAILERLQDVSGNAMMLESGSKNGKPVRAETGRFSIIACLEQQPKSLRYSTNNHCVSSNLDGTNHEFSTSISDVFLQMSDFMSRNRAAHGPVDVPFWGGLVGYISYEAGLETIDVQPPSVRAGQPDVWFVFVERSVVIDHVERRVYLQTLHQNDEEWTSVTEKAIADVFSSCEPSQKQEGIVRNAHSTSLTAGSAPRISTPAGPEYEAKVRTCQECIRAGDSYELCLTDQSVIEYADGHDPSAWSMYQKLRSLNPAPFGAFIHLMGADGHAKDDLSIVCSSPERFLSWSRGGRCQFRPIKGTVQKTTAITRAKAEAILMSQKEQAENLMIVDLIRHDLHGVVGSSDVSVPKLMAVEEYETVFQLVSVIEGQLPAESEKSGLDVLRASLPPGSMTGAPKKRSCELLREIEDGAARGIYSGVLGFLDVGGAGDFNVVIRSAFRWGADGKWRVGAGGAITALSTPEGEFEEMLTKQQASLRAFVSA